MNSELLDLMTNMGFDLTLSIRKADGVKVARIESPDGEIHVGDGATLETATIIALLKTVVALERHLRIAEQNAENYLNFLHRNGIMYNGLDDAERGLFAKVQADKASND